ncbi:MAG: hypothetical protein Q9159_002344 [Coniocarpon cinnabarinum]
MPDRGYGPSHGKKAPRFLWYIGGGTGEPPAFKDLGRDVNGKPYVVRHKNEHTQEKGRKKDKRVSANHANHESEYLAERMKDSATSNMKLLEGIESEQHSDRSRAPASSKTQHVKFSLPERLGGSNDTKEDDAHDLEESTHLEDKAGSDTGGDDGSREPPNWGTT